MSTVLLIRHGVTALTGKVLSGRKVDVGLDERGQMQSAALAQRLSRISFAAIVTSPLQRCRETAAPLSSAMPQAPFQADDRVNEVDYGDWSGRPLDELATQPLWATIQRHPSGVVFPGPGGESMAYAQCRAVAAVRDWNMRLGPRATYAVCSHGDIIKAVIADALGMHLDLFQRIIVDPCSVSVIRYTDTRPFVLRINDTGGSIVDLAPSQEDREFESSGDAVVGGGTGDTT